MPTVAVGTFRLVEREALAGFLASVREAEDVPAVPKTVREEKAQVSQRRLRTLVQTDHSPVSLRSLPEALTLQRGQLEIRFGTLDELAEAMYFLARALADETEAFASAYESVPELGEAIARGGGRGGDVRRARTAGGEWHRRLTLPEGTTPGGRWLPYPSAD